MVQAEDDAYAEAEADDCPAAALGGPKPKPKPHRGGGGVEDELEVDAELHGPRLANDAGYDDAARFARDGYHGVTGRHAVVAALADLEAAAARQRVRRDAGADGDPEDEVAASHAISRGKGMRRWMIGSLAKAPSVPSETPAVRDDRRARFAPPTASQRVATAAAVSDARRASFAVNAGISGFRSEGKPALLCLGAGTRRVGDLDECIATRGGAFLGVDKLRGHGMNISTAAVSEALMVQAEQSVFKGLHVSQDCNTWSPALCLGTAGRPPIGQYRGPSAELGHDQLTPARKAACDEQNAVKRTAVSLARVIHDQGGSVSFESSPDCKDRTKPWFLSAGAYDTAEHFSYWDDSLMRDYIKDTGSVIVTVSRCAAEPPVAGSDTVGYRKYMSFLLNPVAAARATELKKLATAGCTHTHHPRLTGVDANGVSHSRHAEQYPPVLNSAVAELHLPSSGDVGSSDGGSGGGDSDARKPDGKDADDDGRDAPSGIATRTRAQKRVTFSQTLPKTKAPRQSATGTSVAFLACLVACTAGGPLVLLLDGGLPFADVAGGATSAARVAATDAVATLLPTAALAWKGLPRHYAAQRGAPPAVEHIITLFAPAVPSALAVSFGSCPGGWALVALDAIENSATRIRSLLAVQLVADLFGDGRLGEPGKEVDGLIGVHEYAGVGTSGTAPPNRDRSDIFQTRQRLDEAQCVGLRRALADEARSQASGGDLDMAAYLDQAGKLVRPAPAEEVGEAARASARELPLWLAYEPFRDAVVQPSLPLPQPAVQQWPVGPPPTSKMDIIDAAGLQMISEWFESMLAWLLHIVLPGDYPLASRPEVLVVGQDHFYERMRGVVWDCRREREGVIEPLDFTHVPDSDWNRPWLRRQLQDYPCRESVSHICDGADLKADLPLSFCFTPHLLSIAETGAYASLYKDLLRLKANGWYEWFADLPFAPWGVNGQGSRPKPPDPVTNSPRFRRIVSGSDPYDDVVGTDGVPRSSVNTATRKQYPAVHDTLVRQKWRRVGTVVLVCLLMSGVISQMPSLRRGLARFRKERKPRALDVMWDLSIMAVIAAQADLPLYLLVDDFAEFFYQFRLASRCLWYSGIVMLDQEQRRLWCIVETVLAMGFTPSSNIAQMSGEAFLFIFDALMQSADVVDSTEEARLHAIMSERERLHGGTNGRPRRRYIYTDDTLHAVIGTRRFIQAYMQWRILLRTARLLAAAAHKMQLGTHCLFLGVRMMVTLGYATVPEVKLLKALAWLSSLLDGTLTKDTAKRLFGLLVHLVFLDATLRATTAGLWRCTSRLRAEPVALTPAEAKRAGRWLQRLKQASAVQLNEAVRRRRRRADTAGGVTLIGQSDAMREKDKLQAAMGGYSHGTVWRLRLPPRAAEILPISADEFIAFMAHLVVNEAAHSLASRVLHALDNVNAMLALARDSAKAPIMLALYDELLELPSFQSVRHKLLAAQWFGGRLTMADAASRFYDDVLYSVAAALHIKLVFVEPPPQVHALVSRAVDKQERLLLLEEPTPSREPHVVRGSVASMPWDHGQPEAGTLEIDARRPSILSNMALHSSASVASAAYERVLEGVPIDSACVGCGIDSRMAYATPERISRAVSALALYVRAGGHVVIRGATGECGHTQPICAKINQLARVYLQRRAMPLQIARLAIATAGVVVTQRRVSRHRVLSPAESMRGKRRRNTCESDGPKCSAAIRELCGTPRATPGPPCDLCGRSSIASWRVPEACSLCGMRLCAGCRKVHDCVEFEAGMVLTQQQLSRHRVLNPTESMRGKSRRNTCEADGPKWWGTRNPSLTTTVVQPRQRTRRPQPVIKRASRPPRAALQLQPSRGGVPTLRTCMPARRKKLGRVERGTSASQSDKSLASDIVQRLTQDKSPFALRPSDPGMLERLGCAVHSYAQFGANAGTVRNENSAWNKYWVPYTRRLSTRVWRTDEAQHDPQREALLQISFAIDTWQRMTPRSNNDAVAQVQSAFNVLGHVRRKHGRRGYLMPPPAMLAHVARGMSKEMLLNYGKHSAVPSRAEPFTADQNERMRSMTPGTLVNGQPYQPETAFWRGWRVVDTFANQSGERKSAIVGHELGEYCRGDVVFVIGSCLLEDPTSDKLRTMGTHVGDRVILRGGPSKADRDNRHFGAAPRVFKFDRRNKSNFAAAIVDFELAYPVHGSVRHSTPLFVQDGKLKRWTPSAIDRTLDNVMKACMSPLECKHKTFHSKRVWLASALKRNGSSEGEIQALVHWRSPESVRIYGRMDEMYQAECRERAAKAVFTTINASSLPQCDPIRYTAQGAIMMPQMHNVAPIISAAA